MLLLGLGLLLPTAAQAQSMRCDRHLVSVGDTVHELRARCGRPDDITHRTQLRAEGVVVRKPARRGRGLGRPVAQDVRYIRERIALWTYSGDASNLGRVVLIRRGQVQSIETLGPVTLARNPSCERGVSHGTRSGTVRLTCGAPVDISAWQEERIVTRADGLEGRQLVEHERWTYDPGPGRFLRIVHFVNGRVVKVETGGRSPS